MWDTASLGRQHTVLTETASWPHLLRLYFRALLNIWEWFNSSIIFRLTDAAPFHPPRWFSSGAESGRCWQAVTGRSISGFYCIRMCRELSHIHFKPQMGFSVYLGAFQSKLHPFRERNVNRSGCIAGQEASGVWLVWKKLCVSTGRGVIGVCADVGRSNPSQLFIRKLFTPYSLLK